MRNLFARVQLPVDFITLPFMIVIFLRTILLDTFDAPLVSFKAIDLLPALLV